MAYCKSVIENGINDVTNSCDSVPTTVVRIKRKLGTETPDSIFVSSKKKCLDQSSTSESQISSTTVLQKLTTVCEGDHLELHLKKALNHEKTKLSAKLQDRYKQGYKQSSKVEIRKKTKTEKAASKFKFICSKRKIDLSDNEESFNIHFFDAVTENETPLQEALSKEEVITCNGEPMESSKNEYVYDIYYTSNPVEHSSWIENICEVQTYNSQDYLSYDDEMGEKSDSDDSNDEDNWRNDYPDEDEDELLYEREDDFLCRQFEKTKLDSDESYDADDYDDSGDFDEDGNLVASGCLSPFSTMKKIIRSYDRQKISDNSSDDEAT